MAEIETLDITASRGENGGFGIAIEDRRKQTYVGYVTGAAESAGLLKKGDHITHVEGEGPLKYKEVITRLKAAESSVKLTVIRGEPIPKGGIVSSRTMGTCTIAALLVAMASSTLDLPLASEFMKDILPSTADAFPAAQPGGGEDALRGRPRMQISGKQQVLLEDGSAEDPEALRTAMRSDKQFMAQIRQNDADFARIISGRPDGSYDVDAFQRRLRKNYNDFKMNEGLKLEDDGSAVDPAAYLASARQRKDWVKYIRKLEPSELGEKILGGDSEALQGFLRYQKRRQDNPEEVAAEEKKRQEEANPPPPPTPYDDVGQVGMSFRILTDEGEEKDLYSLAAAQVGHARAMSTSSRPCHVHMGPPPPSHALPVRRPVDGGGEVDAPGAHEVRRVPSLGPPGSAGGLQGAQGDAQGRPGRVDDPRGHGRPVRRPRQVVARVRPTANQVGRQHHRRAGHRAPAGGQHFRRGQECDAADATLA